MLEKLKKKRELKRWFNGKDQENEKFDCRLLDSGYSVVNITKILKARNAWSIPRAYMVTQDDVYRDSDYENFYFSTFRNAEEAFEYMRLDSSCIDGYDRFEFTRDTADGFAGQLCKQMTKYGIECRILAGYTADELTRSAEDGASTGGWKNKALAVLVYEMRKYAYCEYSRSSVYRIMQVIEPAGKACFLIGDEMPIAAAAENEEELSRVTAIARKAYYSTPSIIARMKYVYPGECRSW